MIESVKIRLKINNLRIIMFEWKQYDVFNTTIYLAICKNGPFTPLNYKYMVD